MVSRFFHLVGIIETRDQFPQLLYHPSGIGIIMVFMWKQIPFMVLSILSVLIGMGRASEEVARTLGASRLYIFFKITLPQLLPGVVSSSLICCAYNLGSFEVPFLLGPSYPGTLSILAWRYFNDSNYSMRPYGMVVVVLLTIMSATLIYLYLYLYRLYERKIGRV